MAQTDDNSENISEAIILVGYEAGMSGKAADPAALIAVTPQGEWLLLHLGPLPEVDARPLCRWNKIRFAWQPSPADRRIESRRIGKESIKVLGEISHPQRREFLAKLETGSLASSMSKGKSLTLVRPRNPHFSIKRKTDKERAAEKAFKPGAASCPYKFKYRYTIDDGEREEFYKGREIEATFARLSATLGEASALSWIIKVYGQPQLAKGVVFVMGTHPEQPGTWQVEAIIGAGELSHAAGQRYNMVC